MYAIARTTIKIPKGKMMSIPTNMGKGRVCEYYAYNEKSCSGEINAELLKRRSNDYSTEPRKIRFTDYSTIQQQNLLLESYSSFIIEVEIESLITKHSSRFKARKAYVIDNIAYQ
jgi:hypothetical protein